MVSKKGYLITISMMFIVSTLFFFAQGFSSKNLAEQNSIINSYKPALAPYISDDIATDLLELAGITVSDSFDGSLLSLEVSDSVQKDYSMSAELSNYSTFLDSNYFSKIQGSESLDLTNLSDGTFDVLLDNLTYTNNYSNSRVYLIDSTNNSLSSLDLNLFIEGDLNYFVFSADSSPPSVPIIIRSFSDSNYYSQSVSIDPAGVTTLDIYHSDDPTDRTTVIIGSVLGSSSSLMIDSNSANKVSFSLNAKYSSYTLAVPIDLNATLTTSNTSISSDSLVSVSK